MRKAGLGEEQALASAKAKSEMPEIPREGGAGLDMRLSSLRQGLILGSEFGSHHVASIQSQGRKCGQKREDQS